jgi:hypothetical protein
MPSFDMVASKFADLYPVQLIKLNVLLFSNFLILQGAIIF